MQSFSIYPWRHKYLDQIWQAGLPLDLFRNKTQLLNQIRQYRNFFDSEVYIVEFDSDYFALLFCEPVFLDHRTLIGNLVQIGDFNILKHHDIREMLLEIGKKFYDLNSDFEQLMLRIPDKTQKVIPGNEAAMFLGNSVYPNKLVTRVFAAADFNKENYLIFKFKKHHIIVTVIDDQVVQVEFVRPNQKISEGNLKKAMVRECFLNDEGVIESERELLKIHSSADLINPDIEVEIVKQFTAYLKGELQNFELPYRIEHGTDFQRAVWQVLQTIPYGEMCSYEEVAEHLTGDHKKARDLARAVGYACSKNPLGIIIPCHRVIGKDRSLTGFAGGVELKSALLDLEFVNRFS